ncbi:hypothetical protein LXL04_005373 [Taraxacum kok-saghyz]
MRRTRSSARVGSTMKSKFKNDPKNALNVDGDDDFVTPPPGTYRIKKKRKNVTPTHIPPTKPKRKKVLESEGETSLIRKEKILKHKHEDHLKKKETVQKGKNGKHTIPEEEEKKSNKEYPPGNRLEEEAAN